MTELAPCGTVSAYHRHRRRKETPCAKCRAAWSAYNRERYKRLSAGQSEYERLRRSARTRAALRLAQMYPDLYHVLLDEELAKDGLPPVQRGQS